MYPQLRRYSAMLSLIAVLTLILAACGVQPAAQPTAAPAPASTAAPEPTAMPEPTAVPVVDSPPLKVVVTYSILADLVQHVVGMDNPGVQLTVLVGPGGDAHTYEPSPRDSAALAEADVLFENGLEFESWIDDLYTASGSRAVRVAVGDSIADPLPAGEHDHEDPIAHACKHFGDEPENIVAGTGADPGTAAIPDDHTHYTLQLSSGAGTVALSRDEDAEVSFFLGRDVPFAVVQNGTPLSPESAEPLSEGCDAIAIIYTYDLAPGDYVVDFGPGAGDALSLVWEVAAAHEHEEAHEEEHAEEGHQHGEFDPHIWHDPHNAVVMVTAIRDALAGADPANAAQYASAAEQYMNELKALDAFIAEQVAELPEARRTLVTTHDTFGYFARRYGFEILGTALGSVSTEAADPSAGELATLIEGIRSAGVPAIFAENISNPALIETIAREAGVTVAPTLYTDALGEPGTPGATYLEMMRYNVMTIVQALAQ